MKKYFTKENIFFILLCLIITLISFIPFIQNGMWNGDDTLYHLNRIEGMARSIQDGNWFPKVYPYKLNGYGYISPTFYCDLLLIPSALLYNSGLSIIRTYKITIFIVTFLSAFTMGYSIKKYSNNSFLLHLGIVLYVFAQYRISSVYYRGALGELFGYIFYPLIFLGAYNLFFTKDKKITPIVLAFTGLTLSHNISLFMGFILFSLLLMMNIKKWIMEYKNFIKLLSSVIVTIGLSSCYLFPMLEMSNTQTFLFKTQMDNGTMLENYSIKLTKAILNTFCGFSINNGINFSVGLLIIVFIFLAMIVIMKNINKQNDYFLKIFFLGIILIVVSTNFFPWKYFGFMSVMQFPSRLLSLSIACFSYSIPYILFENNSIPNLNKYKRIIFLVSIFYSFILIIQVVIFKPNSIYYNDSYSYNKIFSTKLNWIEEKYNDFESLSPIYELAGRNYLNVLMLDEYEWKQEITNVAGAVISNKVIKDGITTSYVVDLSIPNEYIVFPVIYYKGMASNCMNYSDGTVQNLETSMDLDTGQVKVKLNNSDFRGKVSVWYQGTSIQKYSIYLSLCSLISTFIYILLFKKRSVEGEKN